MAQGACILDVLHGNRLSANGIVGYGKYHERNVALVFNQNLLQLFKRNVALERHLFLSVLGIVAGYVYSLGMSALYVTLGGIEVSVARNHVAFLHQIGEENVFGSPSLVSRNHVVHSEDFLYHSLKLVERGCSGITLVAEHQFSPLAVAHGTGAAVCEKVYVNLFSL